MKRMHKLAIAMVATAVATALGAGMASGGEIYRYTAPDGTVNYVDRPTGAPTEERVPISSKPTNPAQVQARAQTRYSHDGEGDSDDSAGDGADDARPTRAERAAAARERADQCQKYRDQLETYVTSRRLYREGADGEREYLDEKEVQEARSKTEELVVEYCD